MKRLDRIEPEIQNRICQLSIEQLENLGEAILDFTTISDLLAWLETRN